VHKHSPGLLFEVFTEIGIIDQLTRALLEARLPDGLIAPQFGVISHLTRAGDGATPIALARAFQVPKTSMTHTLKGLEKGGYVTLSPNPQDGRSKVVQLTAKGRGMRDQVMQHLGPEMGQLMQKLDVDKLAELKPALSALRMVLDANRDPQNRA